MSIRELRTHQLTNTLSITALEITPEAASETLREGKHYSYEIHCSSCDGVDIFNGEQEAMKHAYEGGHVCETDWPAVAKSLLHDSPEQLARRLPPHLRPQ